MNTIIGMMSPSWMFASTVVALFIVVAATALERVVQLRRGLPSRWVWAMAMVATMGISARLLVPEPVQAPVPAATVALGPVIDLPAASPVPVVDLPVAVMRPSVGERVVTTVRAASASAARLGSAIRVARLSERVERGALALWISVSLLFAGVLVASALRLRRERRAWPREVVSEHEVLVSERFGPAIVGVRDPAIVIPSWVLELALPAQRTIVVHEDEHRRVGDQRLLLAALALLALLPWNVGLWLMWRRLARAIEFDCDERVVARGVPSGEYAQVLLSAWQQSHDVARWMPTPAFAERATGLGRRVEHLLRPEPRRAVMKTMGGIAMAMLCVGASVLVPKPEVATAAVVAVSREMKGLVVIDGVTHPEVYAKGDKSALLRQGADEIVLMQPELPTKLATEKFGSAGKDGADVYWTRKYIEGGGAILEARAVPARPNASTASQERVMAKYYALFRGITLAPRAMVKAYDALLVEENAVRPLAGSKPDVAVKGMEQAAQARNAALRALLSTKADQDAFTANLSRQQPKGQAIPESEWGPPPLILIDGVKHTELNSAAAMFAAMKDRKGDDGIGSIQHVDAVNGRKLYGEDGRFGAVAVWTQGYVKKGGKFLPRAMVADAESPALPANAKSEDVGKIIAKRLLNGVALKPGAAEQAQGIIRDAVAAQRGLHGGPYLAVWPKLMALQAERDKALRALAATEKDRATFDVNAKEEAFAPLTTMAQVVKTCADNYFRSMKATASERLAGEKACQSFTEKELALYNRVGAGDAFQAERATLIAQRHAEVVAGMKDPARKKQVEVLIDLWRKSDMDRVATDAKVVPSAKGEAEMRKALQATPAAPPSARQETGTPSSSPLYTELTERLLDGIPVSASTRTRVLQVVEESGEKEHPLLVMRYPRFVSAPPLIALQTKRNAAIRGLLATDQRSRFDRNAAAFMVDPAPSIDEEAVRITSEMLQNVPLTKAEVTAAAALVRGRMERQAALFASDRNKYDEMDKNGAFNVSELETDIRKVLSPANREAMDREVARARVLGSATRANTGARVATPAVYARAVPQGSFPLYVIDGVKRTDLSTQDAVAAENQRRTGDQQITLVQRVNAENATRLYGSDGRNGAMVAWTRGYKGATLPTQVVESTAEKKSDANPQVSQIAAGQMATLLRGANPSAAVREKLTVVFTRSVQDFMDAAGPYLVTAPRKRAILERRNAEVNALLTSAADRSAFASNLEAEPKLPIRTANALARAEASGTYFSFAEAPQELKDQAVPIIEAALLEEGASFEKNPSDVEARKAIVARKDAAVRALIKDPAILAIFDKRMALLRSMPK